MTDGTTEQRAELSHQTGDGTRVSKRSGRPRGAKAFIRDILIILVAALLISFLVKTFLVRSFYIPSGSMENTLLINDRILVNELEPGLIPIQHGDVVVFTDPGGWLPPTPAPPQQSPVATGLDWVLSVVGLTAPDSNDHLIKRVIGLPGDTVSCCNAFGKLMVNGHPLDEPYILLTGGSTAASGVSFKVTVPKGELWVMGDNRNNSFDSRGHINDPGGGFVPESDVVGRAFLISWPASRWTWLDNYPVVFRDVENKSTATK